MAKTTMSVYYKGTEYQAEDVYRSSTTFVQYEIVSFMKIEGQDYVVLKISDHDRPSMHPLSELHQLVDLNDLAKVPRPKYHVGDQFDHPMSSRTMKVISISPQLCGVNNSFTYFVEVIKGNGTPFYNVMSETFLDKCVRDKF